MATLQAIQMKIRKLQAQAEAIAAKSTSAAIERIRDLMQKHGLTIADIEQHLGDRKHRAKATGVAKRGAQGAVASGRQSSIKYKNPKTGETWSGRGRAPHWIAKTRDRSKFLADASVQTASVDAIAKPKRVIRDATKGKSKGKSPAKYMNPETGEAWSGHGRPPAWIKDVEDRSKFLSSGAATNTDTAAAETLNKTEQKAKSASATRARKGQPKGKQPAKYRNPETGATWSGRGRVPAWLGAEDERSKFLINGVSE